MAVKDKWGNSYVPITGANNSYPGSVILDYGGSHAYTVYLKSLSVDIQDVDLESGRNTNGVMVRKRVATKRKLNMEFPQMTSETLSRILTAVSGVSFDVRYFDPQDNALRTITVYVGDRSMPIYNATMGRWTGVAFNLVEY